MKRPDLFVRAYNCPSEEEWNAVMDFAEKHKINPTPFIEEITSYDEGFGSFSTMATHITIDQFILTWLDYLGNKHGVDVASAEYFKDSNTIVTEICGADSIEGFNNFINTVKEHGFNIEHGFDEEQFDDPFMTVFNEHGTIIGKCKKENFISFI